MMSLLEFIIAVLSIAVLFQMPVLFEYIHNLTLKEKELYRKERDSSEHESWGCNLVYHDMWPSYSFWQCSFCDHTIIDEQS